MFGFYLNHSHIYLIVCKLEELSIIYRHRIGCFTAVNNNYVFMKHKLPIISTYLLSTLAVLIINAVVYGAIPDLDEACTQTSIELLAYY